MVVCAQSASPPVFPRPVERPAKGGKALPPPALFPVQEVWTLALNNLLTAPVAFDEARVFFSIEADRLVAYDIVSGTQLWLVEASPTAAPATGEGLLFVTETERLIALRADDGSVVWEKSLTAKPAAAPVWDVGWLIVSTDGGDLFALRASDGKEIWRRNLKSPAHGRPALAADRVYVPTEDGRIVALLVATGEPIWESRLGGTPAEVLAGDERIFAGASDNFFYCVLAKNGEVDWRWRTGGDIVGAPIADENGRVYFVALDNVLRAMSQKSGAQLWMRPLPLRPAWGPTSSGSTVVVAGLSNVVRGFAMKDGAPAGEITAAGEVAMQPHAFTDPTQHRPMLLVSTRDIAKGAAAALEARSFEPQMSPVAPLPNLVQIAPLAPTTPPTPRP